MWQSRPGWCFRGGPPERRIDFVCPECRQLIRSLLDKAQVDLLATLVAVEELDIPDEALEVHDGPALTADDLIDLMLALEDWDAVGPASYAT